MLSEITLGQYFPGNSVIHRTDPRFKFVLTIFYLVLIFMAKSDVAFLFVLLFTASIILLSRISLKLILKGLKPLVFIIIFTAVINIFWISGETLLVDFWIIKIYAEGIASAVFLVLRLICLITGTSILISYTTSPVELTDAMERLFSPLKKLKVPVHDFSMMMTIALRFIPTLIEETDKIMSAQKARGADFESGSIIRRVKAMIPILIPLFVSAFRRADDLAQAMECRCYMGGEGRTRMKEMKANPLDFIVTAVMVVAFAVVLLLNQLTIAFSI
ncbi:MAG: energy-coupling factor transporter transmembrane component T [Eubacteriales bacterium]|nr:energy-coupling factor transporter transmembrane component T [Eubacteriales bacterium]MDD4476446.1 energy-coupling factor transporter transmembrane component T [Eubacteriales bacterium]